MWPLLVLLASAGSGFDLTIVSGANARYGVKELALMLELRQKAKTENLKVRLVVYNLGGMGRCGKEASKVWSKFGVEFRDFNFSAYPSHVRNLGCYAWKAPIVMEVARETEEGGVVVWLDSGVALQTSLKSILHDAQTGFVSDETAKSIARFAHEKTLDYFVDNFHLDPDYAAAVVAKRKETKTLDSLDGIPEEWRRYRNCNGAFNAHKVGSEKFLKITKNWLRCSLDKACVCPAGSTRANHRQDQAALTLLALINGDVCTGRSVSAHGLRNHDHVLDRSGIPSKGDPFCRNHSGVVHNVVGGR